MIFNITKDDYVPESSGCLTILKRYGWHSRKLVSKTLATSERAGICGMYWGRLISEHAFSTISDTESATSSRIRSQYSEKCFKYEDIQ